MAAKSKIVIIGTGGTIAGRADSATDLAYDAAQLAVDDLLKTVPGLNEIAEISTFNLFSLNSKDMGPAEWLDLARCIETQAQIQDIAGVVVTHGTDTLEEVALFLDLTVRTEKPVVITGAMRAATALSADGPANLHHAVQVCASLQAAGRGVMVVMNGEIFAGSQVTKGHSIATNAFGASPGGAIGSVYSGRTFFFNASERLPLSGVFQQLLQNEKTLPMVGVYYVTAGCDDQTLAAVSASGYRGLVISAFGGGEIPEALIAMSQEMAASGVVVVVSSRVRGVAVLPETMTLEEDGNVIASRHLNPQKSAVLLALTLAAGKDPIEMFSTVGIEG